MRNDGNSDKLTRTASAPVETLQFIVKEGLMLPSGDILPAPYTSNVFWRVSSDWFENGKIKTERLGTFEKELSGGDSETIEGAFYVAVDYETKIFTPEEVKTTDWRRIKEQTGESCTFFIISESGEVRFVSADEFQADVDAYFQQPTAGGDVDLSLSVNERGTVLLGTSIYQFHDAIVPLLENFRGTGEYFDLLYFEPERIFEKAEYFKENSHGAYLRLRHFRYYDPQDNARIGVNSINSNRLRHVQTNAELLVSFELCKNLDSDDQRAMLYYAFQGAKSDVLNLSAAIRPVLEKCAFQAVR